MDYDFWLRSCYTGLAYFNVKKLSEMHVNLGIDGEKWIFTHRQKTDTSTRVPLLPLANELISKYEAHDFKTISYIKILLHYYST